MTQRKIILSPEERDGIGRPCPAWPVEFGSQLGPSHILDLIAHCPYRLKCDRQIPCMSCSKRGDVASCNYSNGTRSTRDGRDEASRTSEAQIRLQKLEQMVSGLLEKTKAGTGQRVDETPHDVTVDQRLKDLSVQSSLESSQASTGGYLDVHGSKSNYFGATHWAAVLENVGVSSHQVCN